MARIAGVNIPNHQHAEIALTAIYGIGRPRAKAICVAAGVPHRFENIGQGRLQTIDIHHSPRWIQTDLD